MERSNRTRVEDQDAWKILSRSRTVAVVGLSPDPNRASHVVASYLQRHGYRIIPVNPLIDSVLGYRSYPDLVSLPEPADVVDIFRRADEVLPIVEQAIETGCRAVWMQEGIVNEEAASRARQAGLLVVMDRCMRKQHMRLLGEAARKVPEDA